MIHDTLSLILRLSFYGTLMTAVILPIKWLFRNRLSARVQYLIWWILLIRLLCPPMTRTQQAVLGGQTYLSESPTWAKNMESASLHTASQAVQQASHSFSPNLSLSWENIVFLLYFAGIIAYILLILYTRNRAARNRIDIDIPQPLLEIFQEQRRLYHLPAWMVRMEIADCDSPHVAGWIRPTIVIPLELTTPEIPKKTWQAVLAHECGHIAQGDFLIWKLLTLLQVVHWFNPILWYAFRRMREDAEFACDDQVLRRQSDLSQVEYGRALLFVAELSTESDTHTLAFAKSQLYRRVEQILHFRAAYSIAVAAVLLFVLASFSFLLGFRSSSTVQIAWEFREDGLYADTKADGNLQKVPLPEDTLSALVDDDTTRCIYVDTTKIALLYSNSAMENGISIALSQDGGQNWINPELPQVYAQLGEPYPITFFSHLYMGFTSQKDGWVIGQDTQYGTMDQFIFRTHDGGYTWELVATQDNEGGLVNTLADAMFIDKDRGFMCFDSNAYAAPIYFTNDGGVTWERIALPLPLDEAVYWNYDFQINNGIGRIFLLMQDLTPPRGMEMLIFECDLSVPGEEDQWKLLNPSEPYPLDAKRATILHSGEGYQLTLPESWAGHFANMQYTPGIDQHPAESFPIQGLFSLYETYNLSHIVFDTKRYGFLFAIQAYPIAQATEGDRTASHVLGQDSSYYFTVVTSPGNDYIEDGTGEQAYKALAADIPDILAQFVADNHLTRNPNFQL